MRKLVLVCGIAAALLVPVSVPVSQPAEANPMVAQCVRVAARFVAGKIVSYCVQWVYQHRQQFMQPMPPNVWRPGFVGPPQRWQPYYFRRR